LELEKIVCEVDFKACTILVGENNNPTGEQSYAQVKKYPCGKYIPYGDLNRCSYKKALKCKHNPTIDKIDNYIKDKHS